ncbi:sigma-54 dependent transcriptional regulator [Parabacteroides sp. PF5-9]|uniref:sigma-54-dependent transcriptional regulator n=1 Tax=Parabacteroides sp. PF5-9 TaxID=1742404 RepID=UPI002475AB71|nr:sigma-54 dependent transcriptional regulator [Parabacteroides sp. PF5-9]MDH6357923.1 two-component system response regulator HydG [Parabacteroides sp. PF5-9]
MKNKILLVEDDVSYGTMLKNWIVKNGYDALLVHSVKQAKEAINKNEIQLILTDLRLPDGDGIMLLTWVKEQKKVPVVIIMTSYGEIQSAVSAMKIGASDFLEKPINPVVLKQKIEQAFQQEAKPLSTVRYEANNSHTYLQGKSKAFLQMYEHIEVVAPTRMSVLITGESGTGKEYAARMIHEMSKRKHAPFIAVDCGILSRELAPSELFGHLKGSFTSAIADKKGVFEQADGGTVFLDEVENLPYDVQVQLLRALQELRVRPVGSATDIKVDIRIIVATNENLESSIAEGRFREDLYHRLNEFSIHVPPLRERPEDIPLYAMHFLQEANIELEKQLTGISEEAMQLLMGYHWGGNLRELRNVVRRSALFTQTHEIEQQNLPDFLSLRQPDPALSLKPENEKEQIITALRVAKGNKAAAARLLKISRRSLYNKMEQYGLDL